MLPILASCSGTTGTGPATIAQVACDVARQAAKDPALAEKIVSGFGPLQPALHAEFALEVARHLDSRDLKALAGTPAGRDLLDTIETALAAGGADSARQAQIDTLRQARLAAAPDASARRTELIRQAGQRDPAQGGQLARHLAAEIRADMNDGASLVSAILSRPHQQDGYALAKGIVAGLTDQELLTLAKTPLGPNVLGQLGAELQQLYGLKSAEGMRVQDALDPRLDSYAHHVAQVQSDLYLKGLPTSAKGVEVFVLERPGTHADAVRRTISGENGLGKDADVRIRGADHQQRYLDAHPVLKALDPQDTSITARASRGLAQLEANVDAMRAGIKEIREGLPADGRTRLVNISWGGDIARMASAEAKRVPTDSDEWQHARQQVMLDTGSSRPPGDGRVRAELADRIAKEMARQSAVPENAGRVTTLQSALQLEVDAAARKGLLIFKSGGNGGYLAATLGDEALSRPLTGAVKGIVTVGAAELGVTSDPRDDAMVIATAPGADLAAPGADMPVYRHNGRPVSGEGSSFAAPYVASVAALMIAANPKITPAQIRDILLSGRVTRDLPGGDDGKGLLDPVKAVAEARKLAAR